MLWPSSIRRHRSAPAGAGPLAIDPELEAISGSLDGEHLFIRNEVHQCRGSAQAAPGNRPARGGPSDPPLRLLSGSSLRSAGLRRRHRGGPRRGVGRHRGPLTGGGRAPGRHRAGPLRAASAPPSPRRGNCRPGARSFRPTCCSCGPPPPGGGVVHRGGGCFLQCWRDAVGTRAAIQPRTIRLRLSAGRVSSTIASNRNKTTRPGGSWRRRSTPSGRTGTSRSCCSTTRRRSESRRAPSPWSLGLGLLVLVLGVVVLSRQRSRTGPTCSGPCSRRDPSWRRWPPWAGLSRPGKCACWPHRSPGSGAAPASATCWSRRVSEVSAGSCWPRFDNGPGHRAREESDPHPDRQSQTRRLLWTGN